MNLAANFTPQQLNLLEIDLDQEVSEFFSQDGWFDLVWLQGFQPLFFWPLVIRRPGDRSPFWAPGGQ
jgi:hypothetical protein